MTVKTYTVADIIELVTDDIAWRHIPVGPQVRRWPGYRVIRWPGCDVIPVGKIYDGRMWGILSGDYELATPFRVAMERADAHLVKVAQLLAEIDHLLGKPFLLPEPRDGGG